MNNNKPTSSSTVYVMDLNANDQFLLAGNSTVYTVESRRTIDNRTTVQYRVSGHPEYRAEFTKVNRSTAYLLN